MDIVDAQFLTTAMNSATLPPPLFAELAFAGRSNVGKSSLINSLAQRTKLARTSSTPGCTRGLNLFRLTLRGGAQLDFVDLPGYGFAQRSKSERAGWGPMIEGFLESRVGLRGVVLLIDVRRGIEEEERQMLEYLAHIKRKAVVVATKIDRLPLNKRKTAVQTLARESGVKALPYSSHTGEGRDDLWRMMCGMCSIQLESIGVTAEGKAELPKGQLTKKELNARPGKAAPAKSEAKAQSGKPQPSKNKPKAQASKR